MQQRDDERGNEQSTVSLAQPQPVSLSLSYSYEPPALVLDMIDLQIVRPVHSIPCFVIGMDQDLD